MSCSDNCIFSFASRCQKDSKSDQTSTLKMDKNNKDDTATLMPGYRRNRDRLKCRLFGTTWIGIENTIENCVLKSSDVRFKSHSVWELKNLC